MEEGVGREGKERERGFEGFGFLIPLIFCWIIRSCVPLMRVSNS